MKFYFDKFKELRNKADVSAIRICKKLTITKSTLWRWETGQITPRAETVRKLAEIINVSISSISDLKDISDIPALPLSITYNHNDNQYSKLIEDIYTIQKNADRRNTILKAILASRKILIYVKDANMKYLAVNNAFLENLGLPPNTSCAGKTDFSYFSMDEAKANTEEDRRIIDSGEHVDNKECFMPGSKKKRICLFNKYPVLDKSGKVSGLAATFIDITQRVNSESLLKVIQGLLERIEIPVVIHKVSTDEFPEILYANNAYKELRGYKEGMTYKELIRKSLKMALPEYKHIYENILTTGQLPETGTIIGYNVNGEEVLFENHNYEAYPYRIGFFEGLNKKQEQKLS
ncbi:MAG TPA: hypothetical protein DD381_05405 [Lentisphaeria bacterium]|nr:MAG: hypothetical protein A2X47_10805 [Lentisphaerae bacterium GWF2_38_69]HBM15767.1 hypothetical protein [Lentisphaeria bacterium]